MTKASPCIDWLNVLLFTADAQKTFSVQQLKFQSVYTKLCGLNILSNSSSHALRFFFCSFWNWTMWIAWRRICSTTPVAFRWRKKNNSGRSSGGLWKTKERFWEMSLWFWVHTIEVKRVLCCLLINNIYFSFLQKKKVIHWLYKIWGWINCWISIFLWTIPLNALES